MHRWEEALIGGRKQEEQGIYNIEDYCRHIDELNPETTARIIATAEEISDPIHPHDYK